MIDEKAREYSRIKNTLAFIEPVLFLSFLAVIQLTGISSKWKFIASKTTTVPYGITAVYAIIFGLFFYVVMFSFNYFRSYAIEHKFGLSNQNIIDWLKDDLKRGFLSLLIFIIFIELLYYIVYNYAGAWWVIMASIWTFITIIIARLTPILIIPLFYKYADIADADLKQNIMRLTEKCGVKILDVFKIRLSLKTRKANAALVGIGKTRRVLLGDTLTENYTKDEIAVVLAHELAHHKQKHIWKSIAFGALITLAAFFLVKVFSERIVSILGLESISDIAAFPSIIFVISIFGLIAMPAQNAFSCALERSADAYAITVTGMPDAFISCMERLAQQNLANPSPNRFIEIMLYDHPPISKRIEMARGLKK